ncbi:hypothetical protein NEDG_01476 [Nematocida displodere]|uniref:Uncharacterized protein n=1 Tax=Nematocida displodere TaxID=1805483 RepID=A0A177EG06_9MICR|nr:hypothetical protein NEDG_01476 [Nematocida displodere]
MVGVSTENHLTSLSTLEEVELSSIQTPPVVEPGTESRSVRILRKMREWRGMILLGLGILGGVIILSVGTGLILSNTNNTALLTNDTDPMPYATTYYTSNKTMDDDDYSDDYPKDTETAVNDSKTPFNARCLRWAMLDDYQKKIITLIKERSLQPSVSPAPGIRKQILVRLTTTRLSTHSRPFMKSCFVHPDSKPVVDPSEDLAEHIQTFIRLVYDAFSSYKEGATLEQYLKETPVDPQNYYSLLFDALKNFSLTPKEIALVAQTEHAYYKNCGEEISRRINNVRTVVSDWHMWKDSQRFVIPQAKLNAKNNPALTNAKHIFQNSWGSLIKKLEANTQDLNIHHTNALREIGFTQMSLNTAASPSG